ncbi:spondin-1-like [Anneissia japonica]|uniref:spondin-1-like n=1 Tax=Anneissia japonica TaxID=1529436 RepID=UPI0014257C49|nr:spondin-1-like [Anneissia japonica]
MSDIKNTVIGILIAGFIICGIYHLKCKSTEESCTDQCYNGGSFIQDTKTCTCAKGYGGPCCEFKTQMCHIGQWSEWTPCTKMCGPGGIQFRSRENDCFDLQHFLNYTSEQRACNVYCFYGEIPSNVSNECICQSGYGGECCECKIQDCELTPWSEWSACTRVCGPQGTRFRTRNVAKPSACGGSTCPGILTEIEECNGKCYNNGTLDEGDSCTCPAGYNGQCCECKIQDCVMTLWSDWSVCSHTCGPHGTSFRTRNVQNASRCGGTECSAIFTEQKPCNRMCDNEGLLDNDAGECKCPDGFSGQCCQCKNVDCELSNWSEWSTCEKATRQVRSRDIIKQPECAGHPCEGSLTENRSCEVASNNYVVPKWSVFVVGGYCVLNTIFIVSIIIVIIVLGTLSSLSPYNNYLINILLTFHNIIIIIIIIINNFIMIQVSRLLVFTY